MVHRPAGAPDVLLLLTALWLVAPMVQAAKLPKRLVLALDAIAYRDVLALQEGVDYHDEAGQLVHRRAFHEGYFPVSRLISTFPSASDVAWTEIFGNRPLPGYQRTYYNHAANRQIFVSGVNSSMDYERQVTWRIESRFRFAMSYVRPLKAFRHEVEYLVEDFLHTTSKDDYYYALVLSPDSAQHMGADVLAMLCTVDEKLQELRTRYRAQEGRELEILILSDHGNNHAGAGRRVQVRSCLKAAGYRIGQTIDHPKDVVLPTMGIESWIELHSDPSRTEALVELLAGLRGVDIVTARIPTQDSRFVVMNTNGHRAFIDWDETRNALRYLPVSGDPLEHVPALESLRSQGALDGEGFGSTEAWMHETLACRYPVALERIVRAYTHATLNPATILVSLANDHVHADSLIKAGSSLVKSGGTHGSLDDLNSTGMLLSSFAPTRDTTANRVAAAYDGFPGLLDYRAHEQGAEWITAAGQSLVAVPRGPIDWARHRLPTGQTFLRVWTASFRSIDRNTPIEVAIRRVRVTPRPGVRPRTTHFSTPAKQRVALNAPMPLPNSSSYERVYALPNGLTLEPNREHIITGRLFVNKTWTKVFSFNFFTDRNGHPLPH